MLDPLQSAMRIAGSALNAQSARMRVVSENIANAQTTGATPAEDPYRRKTITFGDELVREEGLTAVKVRSIGVDRAAFKVVRDPGHPAADANGNVRLPNVDVLVEVADLKEATRSYEANLQVVKQSRDLLSLTIDLLKGQ